MEQRPQMILIRFHNINNTINMRYSAFTSYIFMCAYKIRCIIQALNVDGDLCDNFDVEEKNAYAKISSRRCARI